MTNTYIASAILQDKKAAYQVGQPMLDKPGSVVETILRVDDTIVVFGRASDQITGLHRTLFPPMVATLVSLGKKADLTSILSRMDTGEKLTEVKTTDGVTWKLNEAVPNDATTRVVRMVQDDDMVQIVAIPNVGTEFDKAGYFMIFTLMPFSFLEISGELPLSEYVALQEEMMKLIAEEETARAEEEEEEDEEEEEEEEEQIASPVSLIPNIPPPPPPPQPLNGAATTETTEG